MGTTFRVKTRRRKTRPAHLKPKTEPHHRQTTTWLCGVVITKRTLLRRRAASRAGDGLFVQLVVVVVVVLLLLLWDLFHTRLYMTMSFASDATILS